MRCARPFAGKTKGSLPEEHEGQQGKCTWTDDVGQDYSPTVPLSHCPGVFSPDFDCWLYPRFAASASRAKLRAPSRPKATPPYQIASGPKLSFRKPPTTGPMAKATVQASE